MPTYTLTGKDTLVLGTSMGGAIGNILANPVGAIIGAALGQSLGGVITNVCDGDWFTVTFENDLATLKRGKNGNAAFAENAMGHVAQATLRLMRGSPDDQMFNALLQQQNQDFASFALLSGFFTKRIGDGTGGVTPDTYRLSGGIFKRQVDGKANAEGDTEQSISVYRFEFAEVRRQ